MESFERDGLVFDVTDTGPADGEVVVLLHGFPQRATSWSGVTDRLVEQGYRCLAPDQRGYSPGARPGARSAYRLSELVADARALIDAAGAEKVHLVGHDWGAAVAWSFAEAHPERLASLTAFSVPHPGAFRQAMLTSRQVLASSYMYFFQLPFLPERVLEKRLEKELVDAGQQPEAAARDAAAMKQPGALRGGLAWYRAIVVTDPRAAAGKVGVPTLFVWSDGDTAVLRPAAERCGDWVTGAFRFEVLEGVSHWIPDVVPDLAAALVLEQVRAYPV
ncbi:MAG: alpha/beta hydrolase fold protein [Frankiales bacterium]|nr:alpha/beta hydrolase fold protein [Frankiales bacterium]